MAGVAERRERLEPGDEVGRGHRGFTEIVVDIDRVRRVSAAGAEVGGPPGRRADARPFGRRLRGAVAALFVAVGLPGPAVGAASSRGRPRRDGAPPVAGPRRPAESRVLPSSSKLTSSSRLRRRSLLLRTKSAVVCAASSSLSEAFFFLRAVDFFVTFFLAM